MKKISKMIIAAIIFIAIISVGINSIKKEKKPTKNIEVGVENEQKEEIIELEPVEDVQRYYYNQLTLKEQEMYNKISSSKEQILEGQQVCIGVVKTMYDDFNEDLRAKIKKEAEEIKERAVWAYKLDNPMSTTWLNSYHSYLKVYSLTEGISYSIMIRPGEKRYFDFKSRNELEEAIKEIEKKTQEFVQNLSGTNEKKLQDIHDWLIEDAKYSNNLEMPNISNLYGCIIQKECVCGGFTYSFKYVADMAGIPVISVVGLESSAKKDSEINHAWNMAFVNGKWKVIDVTYDLTKGYKIPIQEYENSPTEIFNIPK